MEMHQIRYFLALAETLNFTRAAENCNVAQPSLTRAIKKLEEEFGQELFRRERARSHLTEFGHAILPALQQTFDSAEAARKLALSFKHEHRGRLGFALSYTVDMSVVSPFLAELNRALPGLDVKLVRGDANTVVDALKNGDVELGLAGPLGDDWDRFDTWPLFTERFVLAVPEHHAFAGKSEIRLTELGQTTVLARSYCEQYEACAQILGKAGVSDSTSHNVPSDRDMVTLVEAGLGVALLPASTPCGTGIRQLELSKAGLSRTVSLVSVAGRQRSSAAGTMINYLRSAEWEKRLPTPQSALTT